jgi:hypothetical protein
LTEQCHGVKPGALVVGGQEEAPERSRRVHFCTRDPARCLHDGAGRFFDN